MKEKITVTLTFDQVEEIYWCLNYDGIDKNLLNQFYDLYHEWKEERKLALKAQSNQSKQDNKDTKIN